MPRMVKTVNLCDICMKQDDKETEAVWSETITIGNTTKEIMLCDLHLQSNGTLDNLENFLKDYGTPPTANAKVAKPVVDKPRARRGAEDPKPCPAEGCDFIAKTGGGLTAHVRSAHPELWTGPK